MPQATASEKQHRQPEDPPVAQRRSHPSRLAPRLAEENDTEGLGEAGDCQTADQRQARDDQEPGKGLLSAAAGDSLESAQENHHFADKAVQRRKSANRDRPDQEECRRPRHSFREPPKMIDFKRARRFENASRTEEQESLEQSVIDNVQETACKTEGGQPGEMQAEPQLAQSQADEDDSDVLHAVVGQQALQIVLRQGKKNAENPRADADDQKRPAPPRGGSPNMLRARNTP